MLGFKFVFCLLATVLQSEFALQSNPNRVMKYTSAKLSDYSNH